MSHFIMIAIDGPSASGKGTLAHRLAEQFHLFYLDTGALYRCVAKYILDHALNPDDHTAAERAAHYIHDHLNLEMLMDPALRTQEVADATSRCSRFPSMRKILLDLQRNFAHHPPHSAGSKPWMGSILDGRDIGTVVCPEADIKFFVTASLEVRARRRHQELLTRGHAHDFETVFEEMLERDERDKNRSAAPALPADDAVILDSSLMSADEVFEKACDIVRERVL